MKKGSGYGSIGSYVPPKPTARQKDSAEKSHHKEMIHRRMNHSAVGTLFGTPPVEANDMPHQQSSDGMSYERAPVPEEAASAPDIKDTAPQPDSLVSSPMKGYK